MTTTPRTAAALFRGRHSWSCETGRCGDASLGGSWYGGGFGGGPEPRQDPRCEPTDLEGATCVDARHLDDADPGQYEAALLAAPLADAQLPADGEDRLAPGAGDFLASSGWGPLVRAHAAGALNLDQVGVGRWAAYWRALGARVGTYRGGAVVWEGAPTGATPRS